MPGIIFVVGASLKEHLVGHSTSHFGIVRMTCLA